MVNRVPFRLVWPSRHLLHRKMTNGFYFFIIFFLVFFNQLSKFLFFWQTILFFTSNECFSHFNVQQVSTLKHMSFCFVFTSSFKNNIEKHSEKSIFFQKKLSGGGGGGRLFGTLEYNFIKRKLQHRCFPVKHVKFLRTSILKNICEWQLLDMNADVQFSCSITYICVNRRCKWCTITQYKRWIKAK